MSDQSRVQPAVLHRTSLPLLPLVMSFNGGFVDTAGFIALQGLFTAHVTGNFVTIGAALVYGTSGVVAKLLALPVFCVVIVCVRLLSLPISKRGLPVLRTLLIVMLPLLIIGAALAIAFGPFQNGDSWQAILTGMVLVAAMAIQNMIHRAHLSTAPPTTLMTGTTTQIMIDLADMLQGSFSLASRDRLTRMIAAVVVFAIGCAIAAVLYANVGCWCLVVPPLVCLATIFMNEARA
jgi:uncharacterized membrane protein YoaK (UPF0700 family)